MYAGGIGTSYGTTSAMYDSSRLQIRNQEETSEEFAEKMAGKALEMFDTDGDGLLSAEEFDSEVVSRADSDGDGLLTLEELEEDAKSNMGPPPGGDMGQLRGRMQVLMQGRDSEALASSMAGDILSELDVNGDGVISQDELDDETLTAADADEDGSITLDELKADILKQMQSGDSEESAGSMAAQLFDELDADGDGVISTEELDDETLTAADADGDGSITLDELKADMESHKNSGPPPPPPPGNMGRQGAGFQMFGESGTIDYDASNAAQLYSMLSNMGAGSYSESQMTGSLNIIT